MIRSVAMRRKSSRRRISVRSKRISQTSLLRGVFLAFLLASPLLGFFITMLTRDTFFGLLWMECAVSFAFIGWIITVPSHELDARTYTFLLIGIALWLLPSLVISLLTHTNDDALILALLRALSLSLVVGMVSAGVSGLHHQLLRHGMFLAILVLSPIAVALMNGIH